MKQLLFSLGLMLLATTAQSQSSFSDEQICKAGIAMNNGRSAKDIRTLAQQGDIITVAYTRDDGKIFGYSCKLEGSEIRWRDQSMSNWNESIKLNYAIQNDDSTLEIHLLYFGEETKQSFTLTDF